MLKVLGGVLVGVVIGAATAEILRQRNPEFVDNLNKKVQTGIDSIKAAIDSAKSVFKEGFQSATAASKAK